MSQKLSYDPIQQFNLPPSVSVQIERGCFPDQITVELAHAILPLQNLLKAIIVVYKTIESEDTLFRHLCGTVRATALTSSNIEALQILERKHGVILVAYEIPGDNME